MECDTWLQVGQRGQEKGLGNWEDRTGAVKIPPDYIA